MGGVAFGRGHDQAHAVAGAVPHLVGEGDFFVGDGDFGGDQLAEGGGSADEEGETLFAEAAGAADGLDELVRIGGDVAAREGAGELEALVVDVRLGEHETGAGEVALGDACDEEFFEDLSACGLGKVRGDLGHGERLACNDEGRGRGVCGGGGGASGGLDRADGAFRGAEPLGVAGAERARVGIGGAAHEKSEQGDEKGPDWEGLHGRAPRVERVGVGMRKV